MTETEIIKQCLKVLNDIPNRPINCLDDKDTYSFLSRIEKNISKPINHSDGDSFGIVWHKENIESCFEQYYIEYPKLTDSEINSIRGLLIKQADCNYGINWETIRDTIYFVIDERWICTDPSTRQFRMNVNEKTFIFKEDRPISPDDKYPQIYESTICLNDYSLEKILSDAQTFGYTSEEVYLWYSKNINLELLAECIFELET